MTNHESSPDIPKQFHQPELDFSFEPSPTLGPRGITIYTGGHKQRTVYEPTDEVRMFHRGELIRLNRLRLSPISTAVRPGSQLIDNVLPHKQSTDFYMLDVADAFPSVDIESLKRVAYDLVGEQFDKGAAKSTIAFIDELATIPGVPGLPLGYPCSPTFFEIASQPLDRKLEALRDRYAEKGLVVTRYLDDLTFSAQPGGFTPAPRREIRELIESFDGYSLNTRKSRVQSLARGAVVITGIALNPDGRLTPAPRLLAQVEEGANAFATLLASGEVVTAHDLGVLHGLNSILHMTGDPSRSSTKSVRKLAARIKDLTEAARTIY